MAVINWSDFDLTYVTRDEWNAELPRNRPSNNLRDDSSVMTHHAAGNTPLNLINAKQIVLGIQNLHMNSNGWSDIAYNYLLWGRFIFEGRGHHGQNGANTPTNQTSLSLCILGNREVTPMSDLERITYTEFHRAIGSVSEVCPGNCQPGLHRDVSATLCPGKHAVAMQRETRQDLINALAGDLTAVVAPEPEPVPEPESDDVVISLAQYQLMLQDFRDARIALDRGVSRLLSRGNG